MISRRGGLTMSCAETYSVSTLAAMSWAVLPMTLALLLVRLSLARSSMVLGLQAHDKQRRIRVVMNFHGDASTLVLKTAVVPRNQIAFSSLERFASSMASRSSAVLWTTMASSPAVVACNACATSTRVSCSSPISLRAGRLTEILYRPLRMLQSASTTRAMGLRSRSIKSKAGNNPGRDQQSDQRTAQVSPFGFCQRLLRHEHSGIAQNAALAAPGRLRPWLRQVRLTGIAENIHIQRLRPDIGRSKAMGDAKRGLVDSTVASTRYASIEGFDPCDAAVHHSRCNVLGLQQVSACDRLQLLKAQTIDHLFHPQAAGRNRQHG
jgi:hypothetical protein